MTDAIDESKLLRLTDMTQEHMDQQTDTTTQVDHDTNNLTTIAVKFDHPTVIARISRIHGFITLYKM